MKLGQLSYADLKSTEQLNQLNKIVGHSNNLVSQGASVFADSLQLSAQTANGATVNFKPSTIYDGEPYANTYLVRVLHFSCTASGGDTASILPSITNGSESVMLQKPTNVTASAPLIYQPLAPLYINESNYLSVTNGASVDSVITVYCAIVARGGAQ